jgi:hypothetical protein
MKIKILALALLSVTAQAKERAVNIELGSESILTIYPDTFAYVDNVGIVKVRYVTPEKVHINNIAIIAEECAAGEGRVGIAELNARSREDMVFMDWSFDANNALKYAAAFICNSFDELKQAKATPKAGKLNNPTQYYRY